MAKVKTIVNPEWKEKEREVVSFKRESMKLDRKANNLVADAKSLQRQVESLHAKLGVALEKSQEANNNLSVANDCWKSALDELKDIPKTIPADD